MEDEDADDGAGGGGRDAPRQGYFCDPMSLHPRRGARPVGHALDVVHQHGEHLVVDDDLLRDRLHCWGQAQARVVSMCMWSTGDAVGGRYPGSSLRRFRSHPRIH